MWGSKGFYLIFICFFSALSSARAAKPLDLCKANLEQLYFAEHGEREKSRIGLAVIAVITRGKNEVLLQKRKSAGWAFPGGKYEESDPDVETCIRRECREELGVELKDLRGFRIHHVYVKDVRMMYFAAVIGARIRGNAEPRIMEPGKVSEMRWFPWDALPPREQTYQPNFELIYKEGFNPFKERQR